MKLVNLGFGGFIPGTHLIGTLESFWI